MTTREKIIVGLMCLTVAYGAYELLGNKSVKKAVTRSQANPLEELRKFGAEVTQKMAADKMGKEYQYMVSQAGAKWTRDPFIQSTLPLKSQPAPKPASSDKSGQPVPSQKFVFTGYLQLGDTKIAVINGMEYAVGEALDKNGYYLQSVSAERAVIANVNGSETIRVPLSEIDE